MGPACWGTGGDGDQAEAITGFLPVQPKILPCSLAGLSGELKRIFLAVVLRSCKGTLSMFPGVKPPDRHSVYVSRNLYRMESFFFAIALGMWDLGSPTRDGTHAPALEVWSLNHCQGSPRMEF